MTKLRQPIFIILVSILALYKPAKVFGQVQKPNVVYVLTDQWRASAFSYAGNPDVQTPHIDKFAKEAVNFANAVSVAPVCTPYRAALLTGRYPTSTGMFLNDLYLPDEELCMAEIFKSAGYNTAYLGKWHLDGHGRLNNVSPERRQGFDYWKALECSHDYNNMMYYEHQSEERKMWNDYSPNAISKAARQYLAEVKKNKPFLLFVSIGTPHSPHSTAPEEYKRMYPESELKLRPNVTKKLEAKTRRELKGYYGHCTATDKAIGEIIDKMKELEMWEKTIFVFTSDHGEMMGSHGVRPGKKQLAWDESIRVPFLISYPQISGNKGAVVNAPINTPDILPSLLSLANITIPNSIEGEDLSELIKSPNEKTDRAALVMNVCPFHSEYVYPEYRGIRTSRYTYVKSPDKALMLFDNAEDPYQLNNLIDNTGYIGLQEKLEKELQRKLSKIGDSNFKTREYYLKKWNLKLADKKYPVVDHESFLEGKGMVQTPYLNK